MAVELRRGRCKRNKDRSSNQEPVKKRSKKPQELRELVLKEINSLNDEISRLEEEIDQTESTSACDYTLETLERVSSDLLQNVQPSTLQEKDLSENGKDIDALQSRLKSLEALTGFSFSENNTSVMSRTEERTVLLRRMSGTCHMIQFTVEFEVQEDHQSKSSFSDSSPTVEVNTINRLTVGVTDPLASQELFNFIQVIEKDKDLQSFFIGLIQYAEWHKDRWRTFQHFNTKYPEIVEMVGTTTESQSIQLQNNEKPGLVFTMMWKLDIDECGHVTPDIQVHALAPLKQTGKSDKYSLLKRVPEEFQKVLPKLGIEQSIDVVVGMLFR